MDRISKTVDKSLHPCFNYDARHKYARVHLPIAPACNIQCNFCNRKYSCMNENRPGVTSDVLSPGQALAYLDEIKEKIPQLTVVGIAGPGDAFANAEETLETMRLVREKYPEMLFCVASNGLNVMPYVDEIVKFNVTHMTITVSAIDPKIGAKIYSWVKNGRRILRGEEGATLLIERQLAVVKALAERDVTVKVNSILIPGVNDQHLPEIAKKVKELGATTFNCMPMYPVKDTPFENVEAPQKPYIAKVREECGKHIHQMVHCNRCRADAAGLISEPQSKDVVSLLRKASMMSLNPNEYRPYVAVASSNNIVIDEHLGQARYMRIFEHKGEGFEEIDIRKMPPQGQSDERWANMARILKDCRAVLVSSAGQKPFEYLRNCGLRVLESEQPIEIALDLVFNGKETSFERKGCAGPEIHGIKVSGCSTASSCDNASSSCSKGKCS